MLISKREVTPEQFNFREDKGGENMPFLFENTDIIRAAFYDIAQIVVFAIALIGIPSVA